MKKILLILSTLAILFIISCQNDTNFGYDILPDSDKKDLIITDTITLKVSTELMDTVVGSGVNKLLIGTCTDPVFGKTSASSALQFSISSYPVFLDSLIADSVLIYLPYSFNNEIQEYYGEKNSSQTIQVYELNENIKYDSIYFTNKNPESMYSPDKLIGTATLSPYSKNDTILSIKLNQATVDKLFGADDAVYNTTTNFLEYFNGIYVKTTGDDNVIVKYSINDYTRMTMYYHYPSTPDIVEDYSLSANLGFCAHLNMFNHDYAGTEVLSNVNSDSIAYIQSMQGLKAKVEFPYIKDFEKLGNISIYRAELTVNTEDQAITNTSLYPAIQNIVAMGATETGTFFYLPEYINSSSVYVSEALTDNGSYRFDIASQLSDYINGTTDNNGLYLFSNNGSEVFNRSIITGGKHSNKIRLILSYSKLN